MSLTSELVLACKKCIGDVFCIPYGLKKHCTQDFSFIFFIFFNRIEYNNSENTKYKKQFVLEWCLRNGTRRL